VSCWGATCCWSRSTAPSSRRSSTRSTAATWPCSSTRWCPAASRACESTTWPPLSATCWTPAWPRYDSFIAVPASAAPTCPNLRPILCHAGGYLPFQWDRLDTSYTTRPEARERISRRPTEYLKRFYYDNANFHLPALRCTVDTVGASQLVLGSDYPFGLGDMARMVSSYEALGLSPEDRARVESATALSLLR
jgi:hypothetical protein